MLLQKYKDLNQLIITPLLKKNTIYDSSKYFLIYAIIKYKKLTGYKLFSDKDPKKKSDFKL